MIVVQRNESYAMNYSNSTGNCIVWSTSSATESDTLMTISSAYSGGGVYRFCLPDHNNLYLTADGTTLKWSPLDKNSNYQLFQILEPGATPDSGDSGNHEIYMPHDYNQKEGPSDGFKAAGCACTCGMAVTSFYSGEKYTFAQFRPYYVDYSNAKDPYIVYLWGTPEGYTFVEDGAPKGKDKPSTIAYIKRYIDKGIPPICHCVKVTKSQHWVVPFKYTSGTDWDSIWVLDPADGKRRTMADAMNMSCGGTSGGVDRIKHHPGYSLDG